MTDEEKVEKLLEHLEKIGEVFECETHFGNEPTWHTDGIEKCWCAEHCQWESPDKECFRHFLLGE